MICSYCGASFKDDLVRCPNCQSENPKMVEKRKAKVRQDIDKQARDAVKDLPQRRVKTIHIVIMAAVGGVVALLLILGIVAYAVNSSKAKLEYAAYERHMAKMDTLIGQEDWEGLYEYYLNNNIWGSKYDKYRQMYDVYGDKRWIEIYCTRYQESLAHYAETKDAYWIEDAEEELYSAFEAYMEICENGKKYVNDRVIWGNEKQLKLWLEEAENYLQDSLQMTEEELEFLQGCEKREDFADLVKQYMERDNK